MSNRARIAIVIYILFKFDKDFGSETFPLTLRDQ
jgi:hypothetical protein